MEMVQERANLAAPIAAAVLSAGAALLFAVGPLVGVRNDSADTVATVTWLLGCVLIVWAGIIAVGYSALLIRRVLQRRMVDRREAIAVGVALAVTALVLTHPVWGAGLV